MIKKIFLLFLVTLGLQAQHTISGKLESEQSLKWVLLYRLQGSQQEYIANASVEEDAFIIQLPENTPKGLYRLIYTMDSTPFLDIIYNQEDIALSFDPLRPNETVQFSRSDENIILHEYLIAAGQPQYRLDSIQIAYFSSDDSKRKNLKKQYSSAYGKLMDIQRAFEEKSKDKMVYHFIKASQRYNAPQLFKTPVAYLNNLKAHYFDHLDFDDRVLLNSTLINDKINDYIFNMSQSDDVQMNSNLQKEAIATAISKIEHHPELAKDIEEGLIYTFAHQENGEMVQYIIDEHYEKLPFNYQNTNFISDIQGQLRTARGKVVPNFTWSDNGIEKDLYKLKGKDYYVIAFWSSTCGHCLKEIPVLNTYLKDKKNIQVVAIGLEDRMSEAGWQAQIKQYPYFKHVLGENKWNNAIAKAYGINATPTYLILDPDKKVLAKPDDVQALQLYFDSKSSE